MDVSRSIEDVIVLDDDTDVSEDCVDEVVGVEEEDDEDEGCMDELEEVEDGGCDDEVDIDDEEVEIRLEDDDVLDVDTVDEVDEEIDEDEDDEDKVVDDLDEVEVDMVDEVLVEDIVELGNTLALLPVAISKLYACSALNYISNVEHNSLCACQEVVVFVENMQRLASQTTQLYIAQGVANYHCSRSGQIAMPCSEICNY